MIRIAGILLFILSLALTTPPVRADEPSSIAARAEKLGMKYKIAVRTRELGFPTKTAHGVISGQEAAADAVASYLTVLETEWNLYPVELIKRTRLKAIVLCKDLAFAGQKRAAIPDFQHDVLYLDVVRGNHAPSYVRKVIHHEYFHIIDLRDDNLLYSDDRWLMLNPKGFKYGSGGKNAQDDPTVSLHRDDQVGFLNRYSMTGVEEDKAELFAHLIVEPKLMEERCRTDAVLKAKVTRMHELLASFCPQMNEEFRKRVQDAKRN